MILIFVWIVIVILILVLGYIVIAPVTMINVQTKEGFTFKVMKTTDSVQAAELLGEMNRRVLRLIDYLQTRDPAKHLILKEEYDVDDFVENIDETFVIGKGVKIHLCVRHPNHKFYTINQLMFVVLHELAHMVTPSYYHTPAFWMNFIQLLHFASETGVYQLEDYSKTPFVYCNNITVDSNPALDPDFQEYLKKADPNKDLVIAS